jgi:carboxylesterase type B
MDRAKAGVATFRYRYEGLHTFHFALHSLRTYFRNSTAIFPNLDPNPTLRVFHFSEIALIFGTFGDVGVSAPGVAPTASEVALSKYMQGAWVAFARDPSNGLTRRSFNWPRFDKTGEMVELGNVGNPTGGTFTNADVFDAVCNSLLAFED